MGILQLNNNSEINTQNSEIAIKNCIDDIKAKIKLGLEMFGETINNVIDNISIFSNPNDCIDILNKAKIIEEKNEKEDVYLNSNYKNLIDNPEIILDKIGKVINITSEEKLALHFLMETKQITDAQLISKIEDYISFKAQKIVKKLEIGIMHSFSEEEHKILVHEIEKDDFFNNEYINVLIESTFGNIEKYKKEHRKENLIDDYFYKLIFNKKQKGIHSHEA